MKGIALLNNNPDFAKFWFARLVSFLGDVLVLTGLGLHIKTITNSPQALAYLLIAQSLPRVLGLFTGVLADRFERRRLMIYCDIAQALIYGVMALAVNDLFVLLICAALASVATTIWTPAGSGLVPKLIDHPDDLQTANALLSTLMNLVYAIGPIIGGAIYLWFGISGIIAANGVSFLLSAALVVWMRRDMQPPKADTHSIGSMIADGYRFTVSHRPSFGVAAGLFLVVTFGALGGLGSQFLIRDDLGADPVQFGVVSACYGIGMVAASMTVVSLRIKMSSTVLLVIGVLLMGAGSLLSGSSYSLVVAVLAFLVAGFGNGLENIGNETTIQNTVPANLQGRVFGIVYSAAFLAEVFAGAVGGPTLQVLSARQVYWVTGIGLVVTSILVWHILATHNSKIQRENN